MNDSQNNLHPSKNVTMITRCSMKCNPGIDLPLKYQSLTPPFTDGSMAFLVLEMRLPPEMTFFSMDGDFAPMVELVKLRKNGGGVAEEFNCERDIDICIGTLSKAAGCHGGFIACSKRWKQFIQSRGRSFIFSTSASILIAAAAHVLPLDVSSNDRELNSYSKLSEEKALLASRHLLESGFHVTTIRRPTVPSYSCRLRVTLTAVHTTDDIKKLTTALSRHINLEDIPNNSSNVYSKL
ncbi:hypothetical protein Patl1_20407 [Pistacia atlantica]|uniref:Uncharacterized protein n=1 Tax=Pistacia atlantica TaxID=434234 RepID=A0ACC1BLY6_9ROSI|nr:hypothetical protein Patl1_20407 [Pistacia atlantica]